MAIAIDNSATAVAPLRTAVSPPAERGRVEESSSFRAPEPARSPLPPIGATRPLRSVPELPDDVPVALAAPDPTAVLVFAPGSVRAGSDGTVPVPNVDLTPQDVIRIVSQQIYRTNLEALQAAIEVQPRTVDQTV